MCVRPPKPCGSGERKGGQHGGLLCWLCSLCFLCLLCVLCVDGRKADGFVAQC